MTQYFQYTTAANIEIEVATSTIEYTNAIEPLIEQLNNYQGALFTSGYEYPGRYTRWDVGFVHPPLMISVKARSFSIEALNERGKLLIDVIFTEIKTLAELTDLSISKTNITGFIKEDTQVLPEELRSRKNSTFSMLRKIIALFYSDLDTHLGLYGAFGYDLALQFEPLQLHQYRDEQQRDLILYIPDQIYIVDHQSKLAKIKSYEFTISQHTTKSLARSTAKTSWHSKQANQQGDHKPGEFADKVLEAKKAFACGDLFEVVLSQTFYRNLTVLPSELFKQLRQKNPAPYASLINLGLGEFLVGASPEMFVRVIGQRVETCPISGTIARGHDAISDAKQILTLLNSAKDESELTMCTDVDRNDKSRICEPGSVKVIGRRQIEMYSRVIHTVDHVEGILRPEFDALDAFLSHTWVVTVTGAPKKWAMQFIEQHENSARKWYGGAIGWLQFNGDINTGLTLRTIRIDNGIAEVRVGATLLFDSDAQAEEEETKLKASAFLQVLENPFAKTPQTESLIKQKPGLGKTILLVDHEDSFVHTLANYLRQTGAKVMTLRSGFAENLLTEINPDLIVLSPGPGNPSDFHLNKTIDLALTKHIPIFGVCLGLQGIVEYFGGQLKTLTYPMHGKTSTISIIDSKIFKDLPALFTAGRYHSLYANPDNLPDCLLVSMKSEDDIIMAVEHRNLPIAALQFHPESILTADKNIGLQLIETVVRELIR